MSSAENTPIVRRIDERLYQINTLMFGRPQFAAVYLVKGERSAILDAGVSTTVDTVLAGIAAAGVRLQEVAYICLTHAHYDHAGGAHALVRRLKHAGAQVKVACSQKPSIYLGRQDILDKIMVSGRANEGARAGVMEPVGAQDLTVLESGDILDLGGVSVQAFDAPGHANGHFIFRVPRSDFAYVGDACGVSGRTADPLPAIAPTAFAPEYRHERYVDNIRAIADSGVTRVSLAHFGILADPRRSLPAAIDTAEWAYGLARGVAAGGDREAAVALLGERLNDVLLPLYQSPARVRVMIDSMLSGMIHDLERGPDK